MSTERRAPVQGDGSYHLREDDPRRKGAMPPGTISWEEHLEAFEVYAERYGRDQSAERIAQRAGFSYGELVDLLGRKPETWEPRR